MFFLAHLSRKNNFPEIAFETVKAVVEEGEYYLDKDFVLRMLLKDDFRKIRSPMPHTKNKNAKTRPL